MPAYLRDLFGTYQVGAIHGQAAHRVVAWSAVLSRCIVNAIADAQIAAKVTGPGGTTTSFVVVIVLLVIRSTCSTS